MSGQEMVKKKGAWVFQTPKRRVVQTYDVFVGTGYTLICLEPGQDLVTRVKDTWQKFKFSSEEADKWLLQQVK